MKLVAPCKDCPDRTQACHGSCEKYKAWLESRKLTNEQKAERLIDSYRAHKATLAKIIKQRKENS